MGEVVRFPARSCGCGWVLPRGVVRTFRDGGELAVAAFDVGVELTCPWCSKKWAVEWTTSGKDKP